MSRLNLENLKNYTNFHITYNDDIPLYMDKYEVAYCATTLLDVNGNPPIETLLCPFCGKGGFSVQFNFQDETTYKCNHCDCIVSATFEKTEDELLIVKRMQEQETLETLNNPRCPRCRSTAITTGAKGFSLLTGFIGSNTTINRCGNCGHSWKPRN